MKREACIRWVQNKVIKLWDDTEYERQGNCYDNAVAESFFKTIKTELIYKTKYRTRKDARPAIFHYIEDL